MQNQLDSPIDADRCDDQKDERRILDRTQRATVGSTESVVKREFPRPAFQANPLLVTPLFYDAPDYQSPLVLPASPGPENETFVSVSRTSAVSAPNYRSEDFGTNYSQSAEHRGPWQSVFSVDHHATDEPANSVSARQRLDSHRCMSPTYRRSESQPGQISSTVANPDSNPDPQLFSQPPATPLIDLCSPSPKPKPLIGSVQFPIQSTTVCDPHLLH
ncbi:hypothetical protein FBUS_10102 [Fasciolopsis buskii]|uniref:Uncharacterized protein n=1 Tax=Fasciolopsis buskii TaxID=27845 RepID=A0A8E0RRI2_9TREM|nr:hypothetical protein FBUS_10102 [Fasciolopsis buski]